MATHRNGGAGDVARWIVAEGGAEARGLRMAADLMDKLNRGNLPDHIRSPDGDAIRALIPPPPSPVADNRGGDAVEQIARTTNNPRRNPAALMNGD